MSNTHPNTQFSASGDELNEYFTGIQGECFDNLDSGGDGAGNKLLNTAKPFTVFKIEVTEVDLECFNAAWRRDTSDAPI
jgi:hypothetical protein